jgi:NADP-dependent 3-hydroxy acid dehydrogenase YdfG
MVTGRIALVTGAGSGIGEASSLALAQDGWSVVLAGRRLERLEAVAVAARAMGVRSLAVAADVSDPAAVDRLFAQVKGEFGRLDLLFTMPGRARRRWLWRTCPLRRGSGSSRSI